MISKMSMSFHFHICCTKAAAIKVYCSKTALHPKFSLAIVVFPEISYLTMPWLSSFVEPQLEGMQCQSWQNMNYRIYEDLFAVQSKLPFVYEQGMHWHLTAPPAATCYSSLLVRVIILDWLRQLVIDRLK